MATTRKVDQVVLPRIEFTNMLKEKAREVLGLPADAQFDIFFSNAEDGTFHITLDRPITVAVVPAESP